MRPRQSLWKWLLAVLVVVVAVGLAFLLLRPAGPSSNLGARTAEALSTWSGGEATLSEPLQVRYFPPSIEGGFELSGAANLTAVTSIKAPKFRLSVSLLDLLMGNIQFNALRLDRPRLVLKAPNGAGTANALLHKLSAFFANAPLQTVRIRDGLIETAIGTPLLKKLDLRVNMRGTDDALRASGSFSFNGEDVVFAFDREGTATDAQGDSAPVTAKVTSTPLTARFSGKMFTSGDIDGSGELEADLPDIRRLLAWIGVGLPRGDSLQNASANGQVHWTSSTLTFDDGTFEVDGNEAVGLLAITLGERPRVDGTLAFETLILDPYLPDFEPDPSKSDIFDWVLLKHLDADLRLSAAELTARDFKLGGGGFTVTARDGVISSDVGALEICDGYADGRLDLDLSARRTKASLKGRIANADAEPCLKSLGFELPVTGSSTVSVDITTGGKSREQLVRGLAGTISIAAQNGSLPVDLTGLLAEPNAHSSGWSREVGTPYSEVKADCSLSAGHLWCQSFQMTTSKGVIAGAGDLDIADQTLDWDLQMTDGKDLADTAGAEAPAAPEITINGLLAAPSIATVSQTKPQAETPELETEQE